MADNKMDSDRPFKAAAHVHPMSQPEMDQFLTVAKVGRLGMTTPEGPYVIPVGYCYAEGKVFIHMCSFEGRKMRVLKEHPIVCFEVDEPIAYVAAGASACKASYYYRSILIKGKAALVEDPDKKVKILEKMMEKYQPERNYGEIAAEKLEKTAVIEILIKEITGKENLG